RTLCRWHRDDVILHFHGDRCLAADRWGQARGGRSSDRVIPTISSMWDVTATVVYCSLSPTEKRFQFNLETAVGVFFLPRFVSGSTSTRAMSSWSRCRGMGRFA